MGAAGARCRAEAPPLSLWWAVPLALATAPDPTAAVERALALQARLAAGEPATVEVRPRELAGEHPLIARASAALSPTHPVGRALAERTDPPIASIGPDYVRVVFPGTPYLSVVFDEQLAVRSIDTTPCLDCSEQERFVTELLEDVSRNGRQAHRLLPGIELAVADELERQGTHWAGALQVRNHEASYLEALLADAVVLGADGAFVRVRYADGREDVWQTTYTPRGWQLDYGALAEDSPLRLDRGSAQRWRSRALVREQALANWRPRWLEDGAGLRVGHGAIGGGVDPRDGTVLLVLLELDRTLAAVVRVDPESRTVLSRTALPPVDGRTNLPTEGWYSRWPVTLGPTGERLAVAMPGRVRIVDVQTGRSEQLLRAERVTALAWSAAGLAMGDAWGRVRGPGGLRARLDDAVVSLTAHGERWVAVDASGGVYRLRASEPPERVSVACCARAVDAALSPTGDEVLVGCGADCGVQAHRVSLVGNPTLGLGEAPSGLPGVSVAPDSRWRCTAAARTEGPRSLSLWDGERRRGALGPEAPVKQTVWAPEGRRVLTFDADGEAWLWDLDQVRQSGS